ncbi:Asx homology domain-containing protein [Annulohypoxylon bovei var. microspora]|nr:Asx homology domain-containing protein [Annulohypoxylon bovei var. microspora]
MPQRKKNADATASSPANATRRSTRNNKISSLISANSSGDEMSSLRANVSVVTETEDSRQDETADMITDRTIHTRSHTGSRPSTAHSDAVSQSRVISAPVTKRDEDIEMLDVGDDEGEDELAGQGPALKKTKSNIKDMPAGTRKSKSKYDNPDEMLTNPRAPLAKINLRDLLCSSKAWDVLSPEEKESVLNKFPDEKEILDVGTESARPDIAALRNNDNFRHDAARYQEDLRKGWHDPEWIYQAQAAHKKRVAGDYDRYLATRFKEDWGIPMESNKECRKESSEESSEVISEVISEEDTRLTARNLGKLQWAYA